MRRKAILGFAVSSVIAGALFYSTGAEAEPGDFFDNAWQQSSSSASPSIPNPGANVSSVAPLVAPTTVSSSAAASSSSEAAASSEEITPSETEATIAAATGETKIEVLKGSLPTDKRYWDFIDWYVNHSILSLVVSGENSEQLAGALEDVQTLKNRGVIIGDIIIVGGDRNPEIEMGGQSVGATNADPASGTSPETTSVRPTKVGIAGKALGLEIGSIIDAQNILNHFDARYSPLWIVRYHGTDYTYEGSVDPKRLFSASGLFTDGDR